MLKIKSTWAFLCLFFFAPILTEAKDLGLVIQGGVQTGGESFDEVSPGVDAGFEASKGYGFGIGVLYRLSPGEPHSYEVQTSLSYLTNSDGMSNDEDSTNEVLDWSRSAVELQTFYHNTRDRFRVGWGLLQVVDAELHGEGSRAVTTEFKNTLGFTISFERVHHPLTDDPDHRLFYGVRLTSLDYKTRSGAKLNGDSVGVYFGAMIF